MRVESFFYNTITSLHKILGAATTLDNSVNIESQLAHSVLRLLVQ